MNFVLCKLFILLFVSAVEKDLFNDPGLLFLIQVIFVPTNIQNFF